MVDDNRLHYMDRLFGANLIIGHADKANERGGNVFCQQFSLNVLLSVSICK